VVLVFLESRLDQALNQIAVNEGIYLVELRTLVQIAHAVSVLEMLVNLFIQRCEADLTVKHAILIVGAQSQHRRESSLLIRVVYVEAGRDQGDN